MCGIFGAYSWTGDQIANGREMARALGHRGPDAEGIFSEAGALLGNRRLAVIDLTAASDQPLTSDDGDLVVVQNGEIYNYIELRQELKRKGYRFHTNGDTEVLLHGFAAWGPDFVERLNGMFAISVYRKSTREMWLYRDRLGVKPLYVAGNPELGTLWFASEIKSILCNGRRYAPNHKALAKFFALNYIPAPDTIFDGISHLPPGTYGHIAPGRDMVVKKYWDLTKIRTDTEMTEADAKARLIALLDDATRIRMRADAEFGAFLSGGLDSASVVGFMNLYASEPIKTYSIGFEDPRFDETKWAREVARRFGTIHQTQYLQHDSTKNWNRFIWHCDQPHGDVSFIPTDQVAALAAREVKMVLTGDGGDELFAGYEKYLDAVPEGTPAGWEDEFARSSGLLQGNQARDLLRGSLAEAFEDTDAYAGLVAPMKEASHQDPVNRVLLADTLTLLPGNNLVKPDRMAMANGLEVRSPFLDYRMAEFAFTMPGEYKLKNGRTKAIYKDAMRPLLGHAVTDRKKQMFTVPIGEWFRDTLAQYCREVLLDGRLDSRGIFDCAHIEKMLDAHIAGTENNTRILRALVSVELWYRLFEDRSNEALAQTELAGI